MKKLFILHVLLCFWVLGYTQVYETTQSTPRIGYTTNYGNSFGQATNMYSLHHNNSAVGAYRPMSTTGPRRSKERPYSGGGMEDILDWIRMNTNPNWPIYVDDDYWDELFNEHDSNGEYKDYATEWFENHGGHFPWDPDDPFPTPVGDVPVIALLCLIGLYCKLKPRRTTL